MNRKNMFKKILGALFFWLLSVQLNAQSSLLREMQLLGFENLSEGQAGNYVWLAYEDRVNRNTYQGLAEAIQLLLDDPTIRQETQFILLDNNLPQVRAIVPYALIRDCRTGLISRQDVFRGMTITYDTDNYREGKPKGRVYNRSAGRIDFVLYPQVELANYRLDILYEAIVNLAPAMEMELWQGAKFTGQVIFPIYNNVQGQVDYIRPGILAITQQYRLYNNVFGSLSVGNFNSGRMGVDATLKTLTHNGRWGLKGQVGITGSSTFFDGKWQVSNWGRVNYFISTMVYEPHFNLQFELGAGQYVYGDRGVRLDCTRYFGEVAVGVFAMYTDGETNGGFSFAIPLPGKRRKRPAYFPIRFRLPEHFDWEYQAQTTRKYLEEGYGQSYEVCPDENRISRFFDPEYIKFNLIRIK